MKKKWICLIVAVMTASGAAIGASACTRNKKEKPASMEATLSVSESTVSIGIDGIQRWKFVKSGEGWKFDGVYATAGGKETQVFLGTTGRLDENDRIEANGAYFSVQAPMSAGNVGSNLSGYVDEIEIAENGNDEKAIRLVGQGFESTLSVVDGDPFVRRDIEITLPSASEIYESEISFTLKTRQDAFHEYGYILTHANDESQTTVPYSFPAITSKLTSQQDTSRSFVYTEVMDWYHTDDCFKIARRNEHLNGYMDLGILSGEGKLEAATVYRLSERILVKDGSKDSYYDMIADAKKTYADVYSVPFDLLARANSNMNVDTWTDAAYGAKYDILDGRGRPLGDDIGTWGPYGYQNGGAEAFGATDILKGIIRYALAVQDNELYEQGLKYLLQMIEPDANGQSYIMPLNKYPKYAQYSSDPYFYRACNGSTYAPEDSWDSTQPRIGAFKYFTRVLNLGELALVTDNEKVKSAFMSLMPLVKQMRGSDFEQAVEWNFDMTPALDYENGGSGGAAAMWAQIMYTASLIEREASAQKEYITLMKGAVARSNAQGFTRSSSLREYPKPESIGYAVRANLELYELTNDRVYKENALEIFRGIYFYYFENTHPYTFYQTVGYGYACARERWEAFMEMVESVVLTTPILAYTSDPLYLDLLAQVKNSALWTLPVNGYPDGYLGAHSDWTDALYVPFEQPTGAMGDNPGWDGGGASYLRHSKELYGAGEIFTGALTFETFGRTDDACVSLFNYTAATGTEIDRTAQSFRVYNADTTPRTAALIFPNFDEGNYTVAIDGETYGAFTAAELAGGFDYTLAGRASKLVTVARTGTADAPQAQGETTVSVTASAPSFTELKFGGGSATHWKIETSLSERFDADTVTARIVRQNKATLSHEDNAQIYVRVTGYTATGKALSAAALTVRSGVAKIGLLEDFGYENPQSGSVGGWQATAQTYNGAIRLLSDTNGFKDYPENAAKPAMGYMAVYKPVYAGEDVDTFVKTYEVDLGAYPYFEFYPYTKNVGSTFSLTLSFGAQTIKILDGVDGFDRAVYRYDLSVYAQSKTQVKVTMISSGFNRGFAVSRMRFVGETTDYDGTRDLTALSYTTNAELNKTAGLTISNPADMSGFAKTEYDLPAFDASVYSEMEIPLNGVTTELSGKIYAQISVTKTGESTPVYSANDVLISFGQSLRVPLDGFPAGNRAYTVKTRFTRRFGGAEVTTVAPRSIRLNSETVADKIPVTKVENGAHVLDGWKTNWAYSDKDGYIYNANENVDYGSIYRDNITVDLDRTPVIRFRVTAVKAGTQYSLKANDGTMSEDVALIGQTDKTGDFVVNLRDRLGRGGVVRLRFDFYVLNDAKRSGGAKLESIELLAGETLYENVSETAWSETVSEVVTVDLDETPYVYLDVANLSYGSHWLIYVEYAGQRYELKTVYESVYGKMYDRAKEGAFKYDLRDILPVGAGEAQVRFVMMTDGENAEFALRGFRLSDHNEVPVLKRSAAIR